MDIFDDYTHSLLTALKKHKVPFIVIGGYAVNYHGYLRTTADLDLWLKPSNEIKPALCDALTELGISKSVLTKLNTLNFEEAVLFSDGDEPNKIEFLTKVSGVGFDEAWEQRISSKIDDIMLPFLHLNHLVLTKIGTNRPKDKIDIEELQKIAAIREKKKGKKGN